MNAWIASPDRQATKIVSEYHQKSPTLARSLSRAFINAANYTKPRHVADGGGDAMADYGIIRGMENPVKTLVAGDEPSMPA